MIHEQEVLERLKAIQHELATIRTAMIEGFKTSKDSGLYDCARLLAWTPPPKPIGDKRL